MRPALSAGRFRFFGIALASFLLGLLLISLAAEQAVLWYQRSQWKDQADGKAAAALARAATEFVTLQRSVRRLAVEVAQHPRVLGTLTGEDRDTAALFSLLGRISSDKAVGLEVHDRRGTLVAWEGRAGAGSVRELRLALDGQLASRVEPGTVFSFLAIVTPVRAEGRIIGAVLVRRTISQHYPLSDRFSEVEDLARSVSTELGVEVEYLFGPDAAARRDGRYVSAVLQGIDSTRVGVVNVMRPALSAALEATTTRFRLLTDALLSGLLLLAVVLLLARSDSIPSAPLRAAAVTAALWGARYALLWLGIPADFIAGGIFDPSAYASKFGGGLARSAGEMSITAFTLLVNTGFILRIVLHRVRHGSPWWRPGWLPVRLTLAAASVTLIYLLLRGYGASVRSAVFDSRLHFTDPGVILPSFTLALMVANLFVLSVCILVATVGLVSFTLTLLTRRGERVRGVRTAWAGTLALLVTAAVLFGELQEHPLMSTPYRLVFGGAVLLFTYHLHRRVERGRPLATPAGFLIALALSTAFLHPLLMEQVKERDRERLESFARELLQPVDRWLAFVLEDGLNRFTGGPSDQVLLEGSAADLDRLAFERWSGSVAGREGYSCRFAVTDAEGRVVSRFLLGDRRLFEEQAPLPAAGDTVRSMAVLEVGSGLQAARLYVGSQPIRDAQGRIAGWAHVGIAAGQQALFRGENPTLLRRLSAEPGDAITRPLTLSEFRDGVLFTSTNPLLPLNYRVPSAVRENLRTGGLVWAAEEFAGTAYETLFASRGEDGVLLALGMRELSLAEHVVNIVRSLVYYAFMVVVFFSGWMVVRLARGKRYVATFRDRLLGALLITSVVPVVVLALYGRSLARERLQETTGALLAQETSRVSDALLQRLGNDPGSASDEAWVAAARAAASGPAGDFNLYRNAQLTSSSRPELYDIGLLDERLRGEAYMNIVTSGRRFHQLTEQVGQVRYAVGYAPVLDPNNTLLAVVSVPTLYRQDEIDREVSQRNALLFGLYAVLLVGTLIIATTLANRIAAPIHALTNATRRVARGDLELAEPLPQADGEVGDLVRSFEGMTHDLKQSRDNLVRFERERAWKEMAQQVAHEIKNPLTPMKLSVQHLVQAYRDSAPEFRSILDDVSRTLIEQIDALSRIASEFSRFARMPNPRPENCDLHVVLEDALQLFEQEGIVTVRRELAPGLPLLHADREELRRAFINILRNGIQAMNGRGTITVTTAPTARGVRVMIRDEGVGMTPEVQARLFQPNFSTKTEGMGLGLAIVKKTIDALGGVIRAESAPGRGTTMIIDLPVAGQEGGV